MKTKTNILVTNFTMYFNHDNKKQQNAYCNRTLNYKKMLKIDDILLIIIIMLKMIEKIIFYFAFNDLNAF